jgi:hypothetical protein
MDYAITGQIPPLAAPGTRTSHINRPFNATLGDFLNQQGECATIISTPTTWGSLHADRRRLRYVGAGR